VTELRKTPSAILSLIPVEHNMSTQFDAASIARLSLHNPTDFSIPHSQTLHRLVLLQHWNIPVGSKVLELGCGQGDCTIVLAHAVGEQGSVVAVDPAELDYGASFRFLFCCVSWLGSAY
jgi:predicted methyltransferase